MRHRVAPGPRLLRAGRIDWTPFYGADAKSIHSLWEDTALASPIHPNLATTGTEVVWACRREMARTVDDVLARRSRALLLDVRAAAEAAETVAALMAAELGRGATWQTDEVASFRELALGYIVA